MASRMGSASTIASKLAAMALRDRPVHHNNNTYTHVFAPHKSRKCLRQCNPKARLQLSSEAAVCTLAKDGPPQSGHSPCSEHGDSAWYVFLSSQMQAQSTTAAASNPRDDNKSTKPAPVSETLVSTSCTRYSKLV